MPRSRLASPRLSHAERPDDAGDFNQLIMLKTVESYRGLARLGPQRLAISSSRESTNLGPGRLK
jgi:hypothetical protein